MRREGKEEGGKGRRRDENGGKEEGGRGVRKGSIRHSSCRVLSCSKPERAIGSQGFLMTFLCIKTCPINN